jgi:hypothetical protein
MFMIEQIKQDQDKEELVKKVRRLEEELRIIKEEFHKELNLHELDLKQFLELQKSYMQLEKRYTALRNSFLGRVTVKYWQIRSIIRSKGVKGVLWKVFKTNLNK